MKKIIIASSNQNKIQEITQIIANLKLNNIIIESIRDYTIAEPDEPYDDFLNNAIHKAKYYSTITDQISIADDSGLCIEALDGFPGVKTKDFMLECGGIENAFARLEQMLVGKKNHAAYFHAALVIYCPATDQVISHEAKEHGAISFPARGRDGFAFDPIFIPQGSRLTIAELGIDFKNKTSHRAKALHGLMQQLELQ